MYFHCQSSHLSYIFLKLWLFIHFTSQLQFPLLLLLPFPAPTSPLPPAIQSTSPVSVQKGKTSRSPQGAPSALRCRIFSLVPALGFTGGWEDQSVLLFPNHFETSWSGIKIYYYMTTQNTGCSVIGAQVSTASVWWWQYTLMPTIGISAGALLCFSCTGLNCMHFPAFLIECMHHCCNVWWD